MISEAIGVQHLNNEAPRFVATRFNELIKA